MSDLRIERGDIFYVGLTPFVTGREQLAGRPGIIVSNDQNNLHSETVEVVYCTTRYKPNLPTHTTVLSTPYESTVLCEQVTTVDISRLGNYIKKLFKMLRLLSVVFQGLQVLQIPYVLTLENISTPGQAKAGLLFCPAGQYALQFSLDRQRIRHITAGASGKVLPPVQFPA